MGRGLEDWGLGVPRLGGVKGARQGGVERRAGQAGAVCRVGQGGAERSARQGA